MEKKSYKLVQSFWVHCFFTGQFNTKDYGTFKVSDMNTLVDSL